ncbi:MAG: hypothetical protein P0120_10535 [Nitrospira sp.]|nr:hypothetical protein [Nitrospira sp.]
MTAPFEVEIGIGPLSDVYFDCDETLIPWGVVEALDVRHIRAVGSFTDRPRRIHNAATRLRGCSGLVCASLNTEIAEVAREQGLPVLAISDQSSANLDEFCRAVVAHPCTVRSYAFYIGRLERDFVHAREAIRVAVESEAGMHFLCIDDGCHTTNVAGIRERTRLLVRHAAFLIADLTLGIENPRCENPSRAHEIGMAIAYERPLFLSSQEPRRYPYFSVADMQMSFWAREDELETALRSWIRTHRMAVARRVLNYSLAKAVVSEPKFQFDPNRRFIGPNFADQSVRVEC